MKYAVIVIALAYSVPSFATTKPPEPDPKAVAAAEAKAASVSNSIAKQRQEQNQDQQQTQNQALTSSPTATNALAVNYESSASTAYAPDMVATAPCVKSWALGGSGGAGGISFGKTQEIPGCVSRELIRMAAEMGMVDHARYLWCNQEQAMSVFGTIEMCMGFGQRVEVTSETFTPDCSDVQEQLVASEERFERAVEVCREGK